MGRMDLGTWAVLSVPVFFALTSRLKGQPQNVALWVYFWGIGIIWAGHILHSYHLYLSMQAAALDSRGVELQSQLLHVLWYSVVLDIIFMALPPLWNLYDKRKMRTQAA
jgi:hypothetical protein